MPAQDIGMILIWWGDNLWVCYIATSWRHRWCHVWGATPQNDASSVEILLWLRGKKSHFLFEKENRNFYPCFMHDWKKDPKVLICNNVLWVIKAKNSSILECSKLRKLSVRGAGIRDQKFHFFSSWSSATLVWVTSKVRLKWPCGPSLLLPFWCQWTWGPSSLITRPFCKIATSLPSIKTDWGSKAEEFTRWENGSI